MRVPITAVIAVIAKLISSLIAGVFAWQLCRAVTVVEAVVATVRFVAYGGSSCSSGITNVLV
jgi:hypothetical protein